MLRDSGLHSAGQPVRPQSGRFGVEIPVFAVTVEQRLGDQREYVQVTLGSVEGLFTVDRAEHALGLRR